MICAVFLSALYPVFPTITFSTSLFTSLRLSLLTCILTSCHLPTAVHLDCWYMNFTEEHCIFYHFLTPKSSCLKNKFHVPQTGIWKFLRQGLTPTTDLFRISGTEYMFPYWVFVLSLFPQRSFFHLFPVECKFKL